MTNPTSPARLLHSIGAMPVPLAQRVLGHTVTLDSSDTVDSLLSQQTGRETEGRVIVAHGNNTLAEVSALFRRKHVHHLPVLVDGGQRVIGIVSATDLLNLLLDSPLVDLAEVHVEEVMTPEPECVLRDTSLRIASAILANSKFRCLPVVTAEGYIYGIITSRDIVRYLDSNYRE